MTTFKKGQSFKGYASGGIHVNKIYIDHVLPSIYKDQKLIIFRTWSKTRRAWKERLCTNHQMETYINLGKQWI